MIITDASKSKFQEIISFFEKDISALRTGRANAAMVEGLLVDVYGTRTPIKQLASISISDARTIVIQPWDTSVLQEIERSLSSSPLNTQPIVEGGHVRVSLPPLTQENRQALVKILSEKTEHARVGLRSVREKLRQEINAAGETKTITEDQKFKEQKTLDDLTKLYTDRIKKISETKGVEILTL